MRRAPWFFAVLLGAVLAPRGAFPAGEDDETVPEPLPWRVGPETFFLRRIVDATTGRPVAGATVSLHVEVPHPVPGPRRPVATGTSDALGWVRIDRSDLDPEVTTTYGEPLWAYAEAPGLGPDEAFRSMVLDVPDWELAPSAPLRFALRDPLDRPVAGAQVSFFLGCGHTPDVRMTTTDRDGVATFLDVAQESGGRGWTVAPGLACRYLDPRDGFTPWQRRKPARVEWGLDVSGTVVRPDGAPASGVAVGANSGHHRGPWTFTDADGRFTLEGTEGRAGEDVTIEDGEFPVGPPADPLARVRWFAAPPRGRDVLVRLSRDGGDDEPDATARIRVHADRPGWPPLREPPALRVVAVRRADGRTVVESGPGDEVECEVPPGAYEVRVLGVDDGFVHSRAAASAVVADGATATVRVALPAPAVLALRADPRCDALLVVEGDSRPLRDLDGAGLDVLVPTDRPLFLRLDEDDPLRTRLVPVPPSLVVPGGRNPTWTVPVPQRVEVRARPVDAAGRPVAGRLTEAGEDEPSDRPATTEPTLDTRSGESLRFVLWPKDAVAFRPTTFEVERLPAGAVTADLGPIEIAPRGPLLTVVLPATTDKAVEVRLTRGRRSEVLFAETATREAVFYDPWRAPGLCAEGTLVRVLRDDGPPIVRRLRGPGPWRVVVPTGSLRVEAHGEDGAPMGETSLAIDGRPTGPGATLVPWLEAGPHEAVVEAKGRVARRLRFTLADGEARVWRPVLRAR